LAYIFKAAIKNYEQQKGEYYEKDEKGKNSFWEDLINQEEKQSDKGQLEKGMLTLDQTDKEKYWEKRQKVFNLIRGWTSGGI